MAQKKPENKRPRNVTLKDVAEIAGVSIATASKALNGRNYVHPETRKRVEEAALKMSFTPNTVAQGLLTGQTGTVGLITNDLVGRLSLPILMGAEDAFGRGQMSVFLCDARGDVIRERHHVQALLGRRVDGLIMVSSDTDPRPSLGHNLPVPVIYVYGRSEDPNDYSVVVDNVAGAALVAKHLLTLGRTRIAHINGDPGFIASRDRAHGVAKTLAEAGLELLGGESIYGSWSEAWGRSATSAVLARFPDVDGIICGSDQIARGAIDRLREMSISVPETIAVTGFDNWEVLAIGSRPQLTTLDMNLEALGRVAAKRLFAAIDGERQAGIESLPGRLVVRGSTVPDA